MKIIVYGDSHTTAFGGGHLQHYYGPLLCYTIGKKKFEVLNIGIFEDIEDGDVGIFCFGEIDCRCHIKKHIDENNTFVNLTNYYVLLKFINSYKLLSGNHFLQYQLFLLANPEPEPESEPESE